MERRHRYRRSEIKERSAAQSKIKAAAKELLLLQEANSTGTTPFDPSCCPDGKECNCAIVKKELKDGLTKKLSDSVDEDQNHSVLSATPSTSSSVTTTPINKYTTNAMPKRIMTLKKTRSKTMPSSIFYRPLVVSGEDAGEEDEPQDLSSTSGHDLNDSSNVSVTTYDSQEQLINVQDSTRDDDTGSRMSTSSEASNSLTSNNNHNNNNINVDPRVPRNKSSTLRASDSHLNYNNNNNNRTGANKKRHSEGAAHLIRSNTISSEKGSLSSKSNRSSSGNNKVKKNTSSLYKSWRSVKEEDSRMSSSVSLFPHLPGSSNLGERFANVDYVDPQRLFCVSNRKSEVFAINVDINKSITKGSNVTASQEKQQQQRDSVVSFTSSSDSVNETQRPKDVTRPDSVIFDRIGDDSYYENDIERCLEDASLFRDSAIYSDDNDQRRTTITRETVTRWSYVHGKSSVGGQEKEASLPPPPVPYKPKHVTDLQQKKLQELANRKLERRLSGSNKVPASPGEGGGRPGSAADHPHQSFLYKGN